MRAELRVFSSWYHFSVCNPDDTFQTKNAWFCIAHFIMVLHFTVKLQSLFKHFKKYQNRKKTIKQEKLEAKKNNMKCNYRKLYDIDHLLDLRVLIQQVHIFFINLIHNLEYKWTKIWIQNLPSFTTIIFYFSMIWCGWQSICMFANSVFFASEIM